MCLVLALFSEKLYSHLRRQIANVCFHWIVVLSLFLVTFQAFILDESHRLLVKRLFCENACENLDAISACSALVYAFCGQHCQLSKKLLWPPLWYPHLYLAYPLFMHTDTRSIEAEWRFTVKTPTPEVGLQNLHTCKTWIWSNSLVTGWRM